jgi:transcriptional regulator of acetoin/glycerol metabolism
MNVQGQMAGERCLLQTGEVTARLCGRACSEVVSITVGQMLNVHCQGDLRKFVAIAAVIDGETITQVSQRLGISRMTLHRWLNHWHEALQRLAH